MKIQTSILPRRDGTVNVVGKDGQNYKFVPDADGILVCEVEHEATLEQLLKSGNFEPVDAEDYDRAIAMTTDAGPDGDDEGDEGSDDDGQEEVNGGMPVEANTPPSDKPGRTGKTKK